MRNRFGSNSGSSGPQGNDTCNASICISIDLVTLMGFWGSLCGSAEMQVLHVRRLPVDLLTPVEGRRRTRRRERSARAGRKKAARGLPRAMRAWLLRMFNLFLGEECRGTRERTAEWGGTKNNVRKSLPGTKRRLWSGGTCFRRMSFREYDIQRGFYLSSFDFAIWTNVGR